MGGKSSKAEGFMRTASFRKSQKNTLQKIERKLNKTSKDIEKFKGTIDDAKYTKIKQNITEIITDLEKLNAAVKDKYKDTYQDILERCNDEMQKLDGKVTSSPSLSPVASPTPNSPANVMMPPLDSPLSERSSHNVQIKLVKIALDQKHMQREGAVSPVQKGRNASESEDSIRSAVDLEQGTVDNIDGMRKKIEYLETEIHMYKKEPEEKLYGFIRESLNDIIVRLDGLETYNNIQIKHERKLALQRAQECMKYLNDGTLTANVKTPEDEAEIDEAVRHDKLRLSQRSTYRPITLDLNITEKLNEELHNVIHKRMEEATRETDDKEKQGKSEMTASTDESFENFDNPESEEEFDFVNVQEDKDTSKSTPVLVTSF